MGWLKMWVSRLAGQVRRNRAEREMDEEMQSHLAMLVEENLRRGMPLDQARREAYRSFGGLEQAKEAYRDQRGVPFLETLFLDLRYGLRMMAKDAGFTAVAVVSLGLGIGANTTIFSFVNALLFRPPAVEAPGRLLEVWNQNPKASGIQQYVPLSYPEFIYYRDHIQMFSGFAAFDGDPRIATWVRPEMGERVQAGLVSSDFFSVLGIKPSLGRDFLPEEDESPGAHPVIILNHSFWQQRLGADPQILGKTLNFNGTNFAVIGVAPEGFGGILIGIQPDFWTPLAMTPVFTHDPSYLTNRQSFWLLGVGRLGTEVTPPQGQAELAVLSGQLRQSFPESDKDFQPFLFPLTLVPAPFRGYVVAFTGVLMVVVGLVLLIACANVANLLLAQAIARAREMAIRSALGAGRGRLIRQMLIESVLVALLGGGAGLVLAAWLASVMLALKPANLPIKIEVPVDWRVLAFALVASVITGIAFGLAPALRGTNSDVAQALKDDPSAGGHKKSKLRSALAVSQIAVCTILLIGAGLCVRSLFNARSIDPGFDTQNVALATLDPGRMNYSDERGKAFYRSLIERVDALPGVTSASLAGYMPLATTQMMVRVGPEDRTVSAEGFPAVNFMEVGPDYFRTMGIPILRGREFTSQDRPDSPAVAIVNEELAKAFWPNRDPIGRRVAGQNGSDPKDRYSIEVVGVVRTGKYRTLGEKPLPFLYRARDQAYHSRATLVVRTTGDPRNLLPALRHEIQSIDPNMVPLDIGTTKEYMSLPLFPVQTAGLLLGAFGVLALILAVGGLYGVVAYTVSQRTHEIGVRMALGASRHAVVRMVLRHGLGLTLSGIAIGAAGAFGVTRGLASLLFGISPTDPATFLFVVTVLTGAAIAAAYIPARRAVRVDPLVALRHE